jgi:hypothetical protein
MSKLVQLLLNFHIHFRGVELNFSFAFTSSFQPLRHYQFFSQFRRLYPIWAFTEHISLEQSLFFRTLYMRFIRISLFKYLWLCQTRLTALEVCTVTVQKLRESGMLYVGIVRTRVFRAVMIQDNICTNTSAFLYPSIVILFHMTDHISSIQTLSCDGRQRSLRRYSNDHESASTRFSTRYVS